MAANRSVSIRKAHKLLRQSEESPTASVCAAELDEAERVVRAAFARATKIAGAISEVQLIGGGSTIRAVADRIRAIAGDIPVRRDFGVLEAIARGGLIAALMERDQNPNAPVVFTKRAPWSVNFTCGRPHRYCIRGELCKATIACEAPGCTRASFKADPADVPEGVALHLSEFKLTNLSAKTGVLHFDFASPEAIVTRVRSCVGDECVPVAFEEVGDLSGDAEEAARFVAPIIARERRENENATTRKEIAALIATLATVFEKQEGVALEQRSELTQEQRTIYQKYAHLNTAGRIRKLDKAALEEARRELRALKKEIFH